MVYRRLCYIILYYIILYCIVLDNVALYYIILYSDVVYRRLLFTESRRIFHPEGAGDLVFCRPWEKISRVDADPCTASLFIEPIAWMSALGLHQLQGKV